MDNIKTQEVDKCYLCGEKGLYLYRNLKDRLYGIEGVWSVMQCNNPACRLLWLSLRPVREDIPLLYREYYTHNAEIKKRETIMEDLIDLPFKLIYSLLKRILLIRYERKRIDHMYLGKGKGRLLEIGCGSGERLHKLKKLGWDVEGVEIDKKAVEFAVRRFNLKIHNGEVISLNLGTGIYDALVMNHVMEHLYEPLETLKECYKLLKMNGILVITTPNTSSLGHKTFGSYWMGLDPPRHLYLFSPENLKGLIEKAGFSTISIFTSSARAESFARGSMENQALKKWIFESRIRIFQIRERILHLFNKKLGEEIVIIARK